MMSEKRSGTEAVVDMEIQCIRCMARLYVPVSQVDDVISSLQRTGEVILICVCGQAQLIQSKSQQNHD